MESEIRTPVKANYMKIKTFAISWELFRSLFTAGLHAVPAYWVVDGAIPDDAEIIDAKVEHPSVMVLTMRSESFEPVAVGGVIPKLNCTLQTEAPGGIRMIVKGWDLSGPDTQILETGKPACR